MRHVHYTLHLLSQAESHVMSAQQSFSHPKALAQFMESLNYRHHLSGNEQLRKYKQKSNQANADSLQAEVTLNFLLLELPFAMHPPACMVPSFAACVYIAQSVQDQHPFIHVCLCSTSPVFSLSLSLSLSVRNPCRPLQSYPTLQTKAQSTKGHIEY